MIEGIRWFNPLQGAGRPIVWEDGIHIVDKVQYNGHGLAYILKCGVVFTFVSPSDDILEAKLNLKGLEPTCPLCSA
jgi:hypothetical protein